MKPSRLHVAAAELALGTATAADLKAAASAAADDGIVTPNLAALITLRDDTLSEAEPLFREVLDELHVVMPSTDEAVWLVLRAHIRAIADGLTDPEQGLRKIMAVFYATDLCESRSARYVGDSHGLQYLIGAYWEIDDVRAHSTETRFQKKYGPALQELRAKIVEYAKTWIGNHAA